MDATFLDLAHALRESAGIGMASIARLAEMAAPPDAILRIIEREKRIVVAADMLTDLHPQETLVRSLIDVGALVAFPAYSPNTSDVRAEDIVLMRGEVCEVYPGECQVAFTADRMATRFLIARRDLIGIERKPPSLWKAR